MMWKGDFTAVELVCATHGTRSSLDTPEPLPSGLVQALGMHPVEMDEVLADACFVQDQIDTLLMR